MNLSPDRVGSDDAAASPDRWGDEAVRPLLARAGPGLILLDPEGAIRWSNERFTTMTGYAASAICGRHPGELLTGPLTSAEAVQGLRRAMENREEAAVEILIYTRTGSSFWADVRTSPILDEGGFRGFVVTLDAKVRPSSTAEDPRTSVERIRLAASVSRTGVWDWDVRTNRVLWDAQMFAIYGMEPSLDLSVAYADWTSRVVPEDLPEQERILRETIRSHGCAEREFRIRRASDGAVRDVLANEVVCCDANGEVVRVIGVNRDVTVERQAARAIAESERRLASAFDSSAIGMALVALEGRFLKVNRALCRFLGYPEEELLTLTFQELTHPEDLQADLDQASRLVAGEFDAYDIEKRYLHRDGHAVWGLLSVSLGRDPRGRALHYISQIQDITARKSAEEALARSKALLDEVGRLARIGGWELDTRTGQTFWTDEVYRIHEVPPSFSPNAARGIEFYAPEAQPLIRDAVTRAIEKNEPFDLELAFITAKGNRRWVQALGHPEPERRRLVGTIQDVTERKEVESALRRTNEALRIARADAEAASRAKTRFLANISHEIRTPLNGVTGIADLLLATRLDEEQAGFVNMLRASGESLLALINDLLDFSKMEASKLTLHEEAFEVRAVIGELSHLTELEARQKDLEFRCEVDPGVPAVIVGDAVRLRQVLLNLLNNAVKFTGKGWVSLAVRPDGESWLSFCVRDTGIGIPADRQQHLFQAFQQVHEGATERYRGTGLGLAISQRLVQLMGGEITVASEAGKGAEFSFRIPARVAEGSAVGARGAPAEHHVDRTSVRILLAEDNTINQKVAVGMLRRAGYGTIDVVGDGEQALEAVARGRYDVVLMDVEMPRMDGLEATRRLRAGGWEQVPILALTAHATPAYEQACRDAGMNGFISKPLRFDALLAAIDAPERRSPPPGAA